MKFLINLSDYLDTGLFLDHRISRGMVRSNSMGKRVLKLFCYTGSFTVYAAAGGAEETVSIDMVILDPPSFSNSKMMKDYLDIQQDHPDLINLCLEKMKRGGLYFSANLRNFSLERELIGAVSIKDITKATTPFDFENKLLRWCYLITR